MKIFCIIPAYNEEKNILKVVTDALPLVDEVVVVDDASSDQTVKILQNIASAKLNILKHPINRGQGAALQTGNEYAITKEAEIIVHFDADGQFVAEEIKEIIAPLLANEVDIAFGSRFLNKKSQIPFFKKYAILPIAKFINIVFLGVNLTDPQSGFRAMNRLAAETINIEQSGMAHCSEILHKSFKHKLRIKEIPITVIYHDFGQKFSSGFKILKDLFLGKLLD